MKRVDTTIVLPRGPQHYWTEMCRLTRANGGFTITEIHKVTNGRSRSTVKGYILELASLGVIVPVGQQPTCKNRQATIYKVVKETREAPILRRPDFADRRGRTQEQIWAAMRFMGNFTLRELAASASTDIHVVPDADVRTYVFRLINAGYIQTVKPAVKLKEAGIYRLKPSMNTGPKPPAIVAASYVFDRNRQEPMGSVTSEEAVS